MDLLYLLQQYLVLIHALVRIMLSAGHWPSEIPRKLRATSRVNPSALQQHLTINHQTSYRLQSHQIALANDIIAWPPHQHTCERAPHPDNLHHGLSEQLHATEHLTPSRLLFPLSTLYYPVAAQVQMLIAQHGQFHFLYISVCLFQRARYLLR